MPPDFRASSDDLDVDSSSESVHNTARDLYPNQENSSGVEGGQDDSQLSNAGALSRVIATDLRLPSLQTHQHASLFYLSLIEGRCRTQAANSINAGRRPEERLPETHRDVDVLGQHLFAEMSKELIKLGMISEEFASKPLPELRLYLKSFDTILNNIATQRSPNISQGSSYRAINAPSYAADNRGIYDLSFEPSQALVRRGPFTMAPLHQQAQPLQRIPSPFHQLLYPDMEGRVMLESTYTKNYEQLGVLGKGGFGQVFQCKYFLEKTTCAVKRIIIPADRLQDMMESESLGDLISEVQALSKLKHNHIVEYQHSWLESRLAGSTTSSEQDLDSAQTMSFSSGAQLNDLASQVQSFRFTNEREISTEMKRKKGKSSIDEASQGMVVFAEDSIPSKKESSDHQKPRKTGFFREPGESDSEDDDKHDTKDKSDGSESGSTVDMPRSGDAPTQAAKVDFDFILYIKMREYPLSLEDYVFLDEKKNPLAPQICHCFHTHSSVRILLAILDAVEYLHWSKIVHRDLKPANIFLSMLQDGQPTSQGYINVTECKECGHQNHGAPIRISPCIGDFGLIADLKDKLNTPGVSGSTDATNNPFPFSVHAGQQAGTKFYCPRVVPKSNPVCPKLDVYSFGVIAFELITRFSTKTERLTVLGNLVEGIYPKDFGEHEMAEGIRGMLCIDRDKRWDCPTIRKWLLNIEKRYV